MEIALITEEKPLFPDMIVIENLKIGSHVERAKRHREQGFELVYKIFPALVPYPPFFMQE
jgi:ABC-type branched-subunit amino acid transport system ATPase component